MIISVIINIMMLEKLNFFSSRGGWRREDSNECNVKLLLSRD